MAKKKRIFALKARTKNKIKRKLKSFWQKNKRKIYITVLLILFALVPTDYKIKLLELLPDGNHSEYMVPADVIGNYDGDAYVFLNDNVPLFTEADYTTTVYEQYSELDWLGRCGTATACIGTELMPTEERGSIGQVKPSGWHTVKYDNINGKYLYNRCHLIAYQLTGENANEKNLITGTRYMNIEGMQPFEDMVAAYIQYTGRHVLYRVTPIYEGANLVASGVTIEGYSVEDQGAGICFYVYVHNVQPGIEIDYLTGESRLTDG